MSLFIKQANLCLPTTITTEMIEISIIFIILLIFRYFWKKKCQSKYWLFEADTDNPIPTPIATQKKADTGQCRYFGTSIIITSATPRGKLRLHVNLIQAYEQKSNSKIHLLIIMKTPLHYHLKQLHDNPCINEVWRIASSLLKYQGWNFSKSTNTLISNFWKK